MPIFVVMVRLTSTSRNLKISQTLSATYYVAGVNASRLRLISDHKSPINSFFYKTDFIVHN